MNSFFETEICFLDVFLGGFSPYLIVTAEMRRETGRRVACSPNKVVIQTRPDPVLRKMVAQQGSITQII